MDFFLEEEASVGQFLGIVLLWMVSEQKSFMPSWGGCGSWTPCVPSMLRWGDPHPATASERHHRWANQKINEPAVLSFPLILLTLKGNSKKKEKALICNIYIFESWFHVKPASQGTHRKPSQPVVKMGSHHIQEEPSEAGGRQKPLLSRVAHVFRG